MGELHTRVLEEIRRVARDELEIDDRVVPEMRLDVDLNLDSMAMIVMAVALENRFQVRLDEGDEQVIRTIGDLADLVVRRATEAVGR
jgi:acyl carrier protein